MKNINILPTELPSRLYYNMLDKTYQLSEYPKYHTYIKPTHNIYITSEEDINENDYIITKDGRLVEVSYLLSNDIEGGSKIILTTDSKLIKDGVQSIDNEFLEWFVNNQSCERISLTIRSAWLANGLIIDFYKITIPTEEPNQEIELGIPKGKLNVLFGENQSNKKIEEVAERYASGRCTAKVMHKGLTDAIKFGANWQKERSYSEEEVKDIIGQTIEKFYKHRYTLTKAEMKEQWLEQFKKN
jgi:hypothetical protein